MNSTKGYVTFKLRQKIVLIQNLKILVCGAAWNGGYVI
jgi:hypothetical protein